MMNGPAGRRGSPHGIDCGLQRLEVGIVRSAILAHALEQDRGSAKGGRHVTWIDESAHHPRQDRPGWVARDVITATVSYAEAHAHESVIETLVTRRRRPEVAIVKGVFS